MQNTASKRVLILGGGFAGLTVAMELDKKLARNRDVEITLINRDNFFLFTPMLHEVAASNLDLTTIVNPVRKMLQHVRFFAGEVEKIDLEERAVIVSHGFDRHRHTLEGFESCLLSVLRDHWRTPHKEYMMSEPTYED